MHRSDWWIQNQLWGEICPHFSGGKKTPVLYITIYFQAIWIQDYETHPIYKLDPGQFSLGQVHKKAF